MNAELDLSNKPGVLYLIKFQSGKNYVGITTRGIRKRIEAHIYAAKNGGNYLAASAMREHNFIFSYSILVQGRIGFLRFLEKRAITILKTKHPDGYNLKPGGDYAYQTPEIRKKRAFSITGRVLSQASKDKISKALSGRTRPLEASLKAAAKNRGKKRGPEALAKIRLAANSGYRASPEYRAKMSASLIVARKKSKIVKLLDVLRERAVTTGKALWLADHRSLDYGGFAGGLCAVKTTMGTTLENAISAKSPGEALGAVLSADPSPNPIPRRKTAARAK